MRRSFLPAGPVLTAACAVLVMASPAPRAETLFIEAALVVPVDGEPIPNGRIIVRDGKIEAVGADLERPAFSLVVDARDQVVTPGFVVAATRIGLPSPAASRRGGDDRTEVEIDPGDKGADEFFAPRAEYGELLRHGITTVGLLPDGAAPGIHGQVSVVSTHAPAGVPTVLSEEAAVVVEVAVHGVWREKVGAAVTKALAAAEKAEKAEEDKARAEARAKKKGRKPPAAKRGARGARGARGGPGGPGGPEKDPLVRAVRKKEPVLLLGGTPADWQAARDVLPIERLDLTLRDGVELHRLAADLAEAKVRVLTYPVLTRLARTRVAVNRAAEYEAAKVPYAFLLPEDAAAGAALLREGAIEMARTGCSTERVLRALTREGALALGQDKVVGSIAKGRRADLLFWSAHPLEPVSRLERVLVGGEWVEHSGPDGDDS